MDENSQEWVMGITGAIAAFPFGVTSFLSGVMADLGAGTPLILAVIGLEVSALLMSLNRRV